MKTKYKVALILVLVAVIAIGVSVYLIKKKQNQCDSSKETCSVATLTQAVTFTPTDSVVAATATTTADANIYKNTDYKFQFTVPSDWKGWEAKSADPILEDQTTIDINLKTSDKNFSGGIASPVRFLIYKKATWDGLASKGSTELGRTGDYVITYRTWETQPADYLFLTEKEIVNALKSFKIQN